MTLGAPLLRGVIGALFVGHGTQKLFGWFDGPGLRGVSGMMEKLQLRPPKRHAVAAGVSETAGGALLMLGALTPLATTALDRHDGHRHPQGPRREGPVGHRAAATSTTWC